MDCRGELNSKVTEETRFAAGDTRSLAVCRILGPVLRADGSARVLQGGGWWAGSENCFRRCAFVASAWGHRVVSRACLRLRIISISCQADSLVVAVVEQPVCHRRDILAQRRIQTAWSGCPVAAYVISAGVPLGGTSRVSRYVGVRLLGGGDRSPSARSPAIWPSRACARLEGKSAFFCSRRFVPICKPATSCAGIYSCDRRAREECGWLVPPTWAVSRQTESVESGSPFYGLRIMPTYPRCRVRFEERAGHSASNPSRSWRRDAEGC